MANPAAKVHANTPTGTTSRRLVKKPNKGGSTDGKIKSATCKRSETKDRYCQAKSYKDKNYPQVCRMIDNLNRG